jgi:transposase InsO family protein
MAALAAFCQAPTAAFGPGCVKAFLSTLGAPSCEENRASRRLTVWVMDRIYIRTIGGWLHLAVVLDVISRRVNV